MYCLASKKLGTNGWSGYLTYQSSLPYSPVPVQSPGLAYPIPTQDLSSLRLAPLPLAPLLIKPSTVVQVFLVLLVSWFAPGLPLPSLLSLSHLSRHPIQSAVLSLTSTINLFLNHTLSIMFSLFFIHLVKTEHRLCDLSETYSPQHFHCDLSCTQELCYWNARKVPSKVASVCKLILEPVWA